MIELQEKASLRAPYTNVANAERIIDMELEQSVIEAAQIGDWKVIKEFLDSGGDVNEYFSTGWTLLLYATSHAQAEIIRQLLDHGADPNLHHEGYTPVMALSFSIKKNPKERIKCLTYLIEANANVNTTNKRKETALMFACKLQEVDFVLKLLEHDTCIDYTDSEEWTALLYAVANNRSEIVKILLDKGADKTRKNYDGLSAYDIAIAKGFTDLIDLLKVDDSVAKYIAVHNTIHWTDLFPQLTTLKQDELDNNIENILYGMGLDCYKELFCGIDLRTFLKLKEEDLEQLGIDLKLHRSKFIEGLTKFHKHEWSSNLMKHNFSMNFSSFEALKLLGNINVQLSVICSSLNFSKNYLDVTENNHKLESASQFSLVDKEKIKEELINIRIATLEIKNKTLKMQNIAKHINDENLNLSLPIFISKMKQKKNNKWILISGLIIASICFLKMNSAKRLWNCENICIKYLGNNPLTKISVQKFNIINSFLQKNINFYF